MASFRNVIRCSDSSGEQKYNQAFSAGGYIYAAYFTPVIIKTIPSQTSLDNGTEPIQYWHIMAWDSRYNSADNNQVRRIYFCMFNLLSSSCNMYHYGEDVLEGNNLNANLVNIFISLFKQAYPNYQDCTTATPREAILYALEQGTSFHSDPVYVEATKLKYTDGTYNFIQGVADADRARKAGYKHLLNTYGTFYKGTERELAESFAQNLSLLNGGG